METTETEEKLPLYPGNLHSAIPLLKETDILLMQRTLGLIKNLVAVDIEKATAIQHVFTDWVNSSKKFEFAKRIRGNAFPVALGFLVLLGILTIPILVIAPFLPSEILMLVATPVCILLTLPQICVLIDVHIEKFIASRQQIMEKIFDKLNTYCNEIEKKLVRQETKLVSKKKEHCIIDGFRTQYGTMFNLRVLLRIIKNVQAQYIRHHYKSCR